MSDNVKPSVPEPPPVNEGEPVTPYVIEWIDSLFPFQKLKEQAIKWFKVESTIPPLCSTDKIKEEGIRLIKARDQYGFDKYKQHLMTGDGRNTIEDARQELGDFIQYWYKAKINKENTDDLVILFPILEEIIKIETSNYNKKMGKCYRIVATPEKVILGEEGPKPIFFGSFSTKAEAQDNIEFLRLVVNDVVWRYSIYEFEMDDELRENLDKSLIFSYCSKPDPDLKKFFLFVE